VDTLVLQAHRHGVALARPLLRALLLAAAGVGCFLAPWPAAVAGAVLLGLAAAIAVLAVARWDRTHLLVTGNSLVVEHGFLRRRSASVSLNGTVFEVERPLLGRLLGYCTVLAGELEIECVPRRVAIALEQRK
jgi:uncharacterized membrane protein YdbT with pleckstrin-like domain